MMVLNNPAQAVIEISRLINKLDKVIAPHILDDGSTPDGSDICTLAIELQADLFDLLRMEEDNERTTV